MFCGSKRGVRMTALALAEARGARTKGVDRDDPDAVERLCSPTGVRLHYRDWPYKREAEKAFRSRAANALVATSTVAAGVNLPARAVVVRDTEIGMDRVEVSMVQQMFGRAGRVGAGEREGWAFLLTDGTDRPEWQARLAAGYTVRSRIRERLPDHLLAEAVQGRVRTLREAEDWWTRTLSYHQGNESFDPLYDAVEFLTEARFLRRGPGAEDDDTLMATELGTLTSRFMLATDLADDLSDALRAGPVPQDPDTAEQLLIALLAAHLPNLQQAQFTDRARAALLVRLRNGGHLDPPGPGAGRRLGPAGGRTGGRRRPGAGSAAPGRPQSQGVPHPLPVRPRHSRREPHRHLRGVPALPGLLGAQRPARHRAPLGVRRRRRPGRPNPLACARPAPRLRAPAVDVRADGHRAARRTARRRRCGVPPAHEASAPPTGRAPRHPPAAPCPTSATGNSSRSGRWAR